MNGAATPELRLYDELAKTAVDLKRRLTRDEWLKITRDFLAREFPAQKGSKAPKKKPVSKMTDEEWLVHLESEPTLKGVDVRRELGKAQFWCNENSRKCSRRFFVNWVNNPRVERTITVDGAGKTSRAQVSADINVEPAGWFAVAVRIYGQFAADQFKAEGWRKVDPYYRKAILKELL